MDSLSADVARRHEGFAAFYEAEVIGQVRSATLIVGSRTVAQDVVHDAFVALLDRWAELDEPGPYLQRTVVNGCRDVLRRRSVADRFARRPARPADVPAVDADLFDALARLRFNHRAAIVLRFYLQLTENEIAEHLGCRPGSVGPWIRRGLDELAIQLGFEPARFNKETP
jgi:RNA polymerase sigma factor (sigma-70 family)